MQNVKLFRFNNIVIIKQFNKIKTTNAQKITKLNNLKKKTLNSVIVRPLYNRLTKNDNT